MADSISYTPTTWADGADGGTPITAARLNNIEQGINNATTQVNANTKDIKTLGDSVSRVSFGTEVTSIYIQSYGGNPVISFRTKDGTEIAVRFNMTKMAIEKAW